MSLSDIRRKGFAGAGLSEEEMACVEAGLRSDSDEDLLCSAEIALFCLTSEAIRSKAADVACLLLSQRRQNPDFRVVGLFHSIPFERWGYDSALVEAVLLAGGGDMESRINVLPLLLALKRNRNLDLADVALERLRHDEEDLVRQAFRGFNS